MIYFQGKNYSSILKAFWVQFDIRPNSSFRLYGFRKLQQLAFAQQQTLFFAQQRTPPIIPKNTTMGPAMSSAVAQGWVWHSRRMSIPTNSHSWKQLQSSLVLILYWSLYLWNIKYIYILKVRFVQLEYQNTYFPDWARQRPKRRKKKQGQRR